MTRRRTNPVQDLMLSYRAEAADLTRYLADLTAALGLPVTATQAERLDRARALAAQPCCVTFTVPEDWKEPLPD